MIFDVKQAFTTVLLLHLVNFTLSHYSFAGPPREFHRGVLQIDLQLTFIENCDKTPSSTRLLFAPL